jgi:hypothetical protein
MISFKEQFDKLTEAYIRNEVNPYEPCGCFVGNLLNRHQDWVTVRLSWASPIADRSLPFYEDGYKCIKKESDGTYTPQEITDLEFLFMMTYEINGGTSSQTKSEKEEDALFIAFETTLDALKKLHEANGEKVDEFTFKKRTLQTV